MPTDVDEDTFLDRLIESIAATGDHFATRLAIRGSEDIWVHAKIGGRSNKHSVFGNIYMIPKDVRTEAVRAAFGARVKEVIRNHFLGETGTAPGIDLPIQTILRNDYIEEDDA